MNIQLISACKYTTTMFTRVLYSPWEMNTFHMILSLNFLPINFPTNSAHVFANFNTICNLFYVLMQNFPTTWNRKMKNIVNLIDGIPFDKFYFEVAILLPNILFVSSVLFNSEVWYNLTNSELDLLETVDVDLLRGILKAPKSTPKEMLFLELGILHLREMGKAIWLDSPAK